MTELTLFLPSLDREFEPFEDRFSVGDVVFADISFHARSWEAIHPSRRRTADERSSDATFNRMVCMVEVVDPNPIVSLESDRLVRGPLYFLSSDSGALAVPALAAGQLIPVEARIVVDQACVARSSGVLSKYQRQKMHAAVGPLRIQSLAKIEKSGGTADVSSTTGGFGDYLACVSL